MMLSFTSNVEEIHRPRSQYTFDISRQQNVVSFDSLFSAAGEEYFDPESPIDITTNFSSNVHHQEFYVPDEVTRGVCARYELSNTCDLSTQEYETLSPLADEPHHSKMSSSLRQSEPPPVDFCEQYLIQEPFQVQGEEEENNWKAPPVPFFTIASQFLSVLPLEQLVATIHQILEVSSHLQISFVSWELTWKCDYLNYDEHARFNIRIFDASSPQCPSSSHVVEFQRMDRNSWVSNALFNEVQLFVGPNANKKVEDGLQDVVALSFPGAATSQSTAAQISSEVGPLFYDESLRAAAAEIRGSSDRACLQGVRAACSLFRQLRQPQRPPCPQVDLVGQSQVPMHIKADEDCCEKQGGREDAERECVEALVELVSEWHVPRQQACLHAIACLAELCFHGGASCDVCELLVHSSRTNRVDFVKVLLALSTHDGEFDTRITRDTAARLVSWFYERDRLTLHRLVGEELLQQFLLARPQFFAV